jgi:hypothetical protein
VKEAAVVLLTGLIHQTYFLLAAAFGLLLLRGLFKRDTRKGWLYDVVYAYTIIPFLVRALHLK